MLEVKDLGLYVGPTGRLAKALTRNGKSNASFFARSAAVVRDRRDIFNQLDVQAGRLQRSDRTLATTAGTFDSNLDVTHTELGGLLRSLLSRALAGERRALSATLETTGSSAGPAQGVAFRIGDRHRCVVECRVHVSDAVTDIASNTFFLVSLCHGKGLFIVWVYVELMVGRMLGSADDGKS